MCGTEKTFLWHKPHWRIQVRTDFCNVFSVSVSIDVRLEWRIQDFQSGKGTSLKEDAIFFSPNFPENIISICGRGRPLQPNHRAYGKCELSLTLSTLRTHNKCRRKLKNSIYCILHNKQLTIVFEHNYLWFSFFNIYM